jgi:hypothetical protein
MDQEEIIFRKIADQLAKENNSVNLGKMMSSPGIKYKNKVFAFYYNKQMVFRLGKEFDPKSFQIEKFSLLNPFKNKPPLAGWFQITFADQDKWEKLARRALLLIAKEMEK